MDVTQDKPPRRHSLFVWAAYGFALLLLLGVGVTAVEVTELRLENRWARDLFASTRRKPPHPFLQTVAADQVDHVNAAGMRGDPIAVEKPAGAVRIMTLGGSTTLGVKNRYQETYPYALQQRLRAKYPGATIEVQNAGVGWYATPHMLVNYELRLRQYHPDIVIVFEAINDLYRSFSPSWFAQGPYQPDYGHYLGPIARFFGPDAEALSPDERGEWLLRRQIRHFFTREPSPYSYSGPPLAELTSRLEPVDVNSFKSLDSYRNYYARLLDTLHRNGVRVIVASQPFLYRSDLDSDLLGTLFIPQVFCAEDGRYPNIESMARGMRQFNDAAHELAIRAGDEFLDLEPAIPKTGRFFADDVHLTAQANAVVAYMVTDAVAKTGIIPGSQPTKPGSSPPVR